MAQVWQGDDLVLGREVAVKVLHSHLCADENFVARFRSEAVAAARLSHPGVVAVFDTISENGVEAIVMELLKGITLREYMDQHDPVQIRDAVEIAIEVTEALGEAHRADLVHRDIKPGNIMLCEDRRVKVTDFGIAKASAAVDLTTRGTLVGTAKYLAPEQVEGKPTDGRADIYALGVVLYEMLCGRPPFEADSDVATATMRLQRDPVRPRQIRATIPLELDRVVMRALARDRDERYRDVAEFRAALAATLDADERADIEVVAEPARLGFVHTERRWLVPVVLIGLVALSLTIAGLLIGRTDTGQQIYENARDVVGLPVDEDTIDEPPPEVEVVAEAVVIATRPFDPEGTGEPGENDGTASLAVDGDPTTAWSTEGYDSRQFGGLKSGVGLIIELATPLPLDRLVVSSPNRGWSAQVRVAAGVPETLEGWGSAVVELTAIDRDEVDFELGGVEASALLLWITDLGDGEPRVKVEISEVLVDAT